jgi:uncharacterized OB-fold protein
LYNSSILQFKVNDRSDRKTKKSQMIGIVKIDGSSTGLVYRLLNLEPDELKIGMKMKIEWEENPKGDHSDIKGFTRV